MPSEARESKIASKRIAILIPCHKEELTAAEVVRGFRAELPEARVLVFDNNSTDRTVERALQAGAPFFLPETRQRFRRPDNVSSGGC